MAFTKDKLSKQYNSFKKLAYKYFEEGNFEKSKKYIEVCARIGYKYNFSYCDDELEHLISCISQALYKEAKVTPKNGKIVFYDSFCIDNRGLTQQYIRAIFSWGFDMLFITSAKKIGNDILSELKAGNSTILQIDSSPLNQNKEYYQEIILRFQPEAILQHFSPWDIEGFILWHRITGADRYLINLTDHAFWLGKCCTDHILEFRRYGIYLSLHQRRIDAKKLLFQPYYPIESKKAFQGFNIPQNKTLLFSGSSYYKIYGKDKIFLKLVRQVLEANDNAVFLLAGNGNDRPIKKFIKEHNLGERFFLLGNRNDISAVITNIDIYINTYPMIGGLMSQYAAVKHKAIIGYTDPELYCFNDTEDFLGVPKAELLLKSSIDDFLKEVTLLINSDKQRKINIEHSKNSVITPEQFSKTLFSNLFEKKKNVDFDLNDIKVNVDAIRDLYFDMEINYINEHYSIIWDHLGMSILRDKPFLGVKTIFYKVTKKISFI